MITEITYGMRVYRLPSTSPAQCFEAFHVSEMTGRTLKLITVVPFHVWGQPKSPYFMSMQIPSEELIDEQEFRRLTQVAAGRTSKCASTPVPNNSLSRI